jgi:hypothetical protein
LSLDDGTTLPLRGFDDEKTMTSARGLRTLSSWRRSRRD